MKPIVIYVDCDALPEERAILDAHGVEEMDSLTSWTVGITTTDPDLDMDAAIGGPARLRLVDQEDGLERRFSLLVTAMAYEGQIPEGHRYVLTLSSIAWPLTKRAGYRRFVDESAPEIVATVLRDAGIAADQVVWRLSGRYARRPQCVQNGETDWEFVERLLAEEGISYWFDEKKPEDGEGGIIVFGDSAEAHELIGVVPFDDAQGMERTQRGFWSLEVEQAIVPTSVRIRDFDERHPDVYVEATAGEPTRWAGFEARLDEGEDDPEYPDGPGPAPARRAPRPPPGVLDDERTDFDKEYTKGGDSPRSSRGGTVQPEPAEADDGRKLHVLYLEDVHFHLESAVLLPDGGESDLNGVVGLPAMRTILLEARDHPARKLLIAGHTDTLGPQVDNKILSERRACSVLHVLLGERDAWATLAHNQSRTRDIKHILRWAATTWGWPCDPGVVDDRLDRATVDATREFQKAYSEEFSPKLSPSGIFDRATWAGVFNLYMDDLGTMVRPDGGLEALRQGLRFIGPTRRAVGFGERYPRDDLGNEKESEANRRVEALFFDPEHVPASDDDVYREGNDYRRVPVPPRPWLRSSEVLLQLTEVKGLYKPGQEDGGKASGYLAGYKSEDNLGRIFINTVPHSPGQDWQASWKKKSQYIELTVELEPLVSGTVLPRQLEVVWEWEEHTVSERVGLPAKKQRKRVDYPRGGSDHPRFEQVDPHRMNELSEGSVTTAVHGGRARVRLHCPNIGGDSLSVRVKLPGPARPDDDKAGRSDRTGVMTMWKRIDVEYHKMPSAVDLPFDQVTAAFREYCVQMDVAPPQEMKDERFLGDTDPLADWRATTLVQAAPWGVFKNAGKPGWFLALAVNEMAKDESSIVSVQPYDGPAEYEKRGRMHAIVIPAVLDLKRPIHSVRVEEGTSGVFYSVYKAILDPPYKPARTLLLLWPSDYQPEWIEESDGSQRLAYSVTDFYYPSRGELHDNTVDHVGYGFPNPLSVTVFSGGRRWSGISPPVIAWGERFFAGRTVVFTRSPGLHYPPATVELSLDRLYQPGDEVSLTLRDVTVSYTAAHGDDAAAVGRGLAAALRAHPELGKAFEIRRRNGTFFKIVSLNTIREADNGVAVLLEEVLGGVSYKRVTELGGAGPNTEQIALTLVHELGHAFGFPHKCGYPAETGPDDSCAMNYETTFLYKDADHPDRGVQHLVTGKESVYLCRRHASSVRRVHLDENPLLWTRW